MPATQSQWLKNAILALVVVLFALQVSAFAGMDQAKPGETAGPVAPAPTDPHAGSTAMPAGASSADEFQTALADMFHKQNRTEFEKNIHLDAFRLLAIQHKDQLKIMDSWARQSLSEIRNRQSVDGKDPLYIALDMAFRPAYWGDKNVIYVQSVPIRQDLARFAPGATEADRQIEAKRIVEKAVVSPDFLRQSDVLNFLDQLSQDTRKTGQVNKVFNALAPFGVGNNEKFLLVHSLNFLPPPPSMRGGPWINPIMLDPQFAPAGTAELSIYTPEQTLKIRLAFNQLFTGWIQNDVATANTGIASLVAVVPTIDPQAYPSANKRTVELWYNRSFNGTLVAFVYFLAMVLFFMVAVGVSPKNGKVEKTALVIYAIAVAIHVTAMGVRWWLAERIPIQSQFESILGSACSGCFIGLLLESWKRTGIFGTAFSFVGFLAATSLLAAPFVFGQDLGAGIAKVAGILDDYWLYIHVNIVIASYALISASFCIGAIYLLVRQWHWVNPIEPGSDELTAGAPASGTSPKTGPASKMAQALTLQQSQIVAQRTTFLDTLDQANMVVLQMAFWFLGIGIICGAVWADHSWGRPWGWDPKETFALVTWMVYLVIVHLRLVVRQKADTTAWMSVVGFGVMMFNWVGVNFWLVGLHSYA